MTLRNAGYNSAATMEIIDSITVLMSYGLITKVAPTNTFSGLNASPLGAGLLHNNPIPASSNLGNMSGFLNNTINASGNANANGSYITQNTSFPNNHQYSSSNLHYTASSTSSNISSNNSHHHQNHFNNHHHHNNYQMNGYTSSHSLGMLVPNTSLGKPNKKI